MVNLDCSVQLQNMGLGLREETELPEENPRMHRENMKTPPKKVGPKIWTPKPLAVQCVLVNVQ